MKILIRRLIRSRLIWIYTVCKCVSECLMSEFTRLYPTCVFRICGIINGLSGIIKPLPQLGAVMPFHLKKHEHAVPSGCKWRTITIHHECPCRIEISHPRCRNFNQGRGLPSPWLNSDPEGEISLSYMDRLMMDCFSPTFSRFFVGT